MNYKYIRDIFCFLGLIILIGIVAFSCSTRKNNAINRAYHNVTSHFNVNFNGQQALLEGEAEHKKLCKDNYISTLPIYVYPPKEELSSIFPKMDYVITKAAKSIYKHSMFFKGKEYVKPIDDAYLMMGKAYFYKQDYVQAQRIFNYIISTHKNGNCREEAMIWEARCSMCQKYFSRADDRIAESRYLILNKKSKKLNLLYAAAGAEYHLSAPDGEIETAITYIEDVLKNKPDKDFKYRMYFILGQLQEKMEQPTLAHSYFYKVAKRCPDYTMAFNAQMHLAANYDGTPESRARIMKELNKMLKDSKNTDYYDQIYYAMSEISRIDEDTAERIKYLVQSVAAYTDDDFQRTHSSLLVADLYFSQEKYPEAKAYYDTAIVSMPKNYPNYEYIKKKSQILTELVDNLQVIYVEDSLQRIANMSVSARNQWVRAKIAAYKAEKTRAEREEAAKNAALQSALGYTNYSNTNFNANASNKWYFYNSSLMSAGKTEFLRRWGNRKLSDNWRISNKQMLSFEDMANMNNPKEVIDTNEYDENGNVIKDRETDPEKEQYYLQDLPLTQGAIDTSNQKIAEAMYQAAIIYFDLLQDHDRGMDMLNKFYTRFPNHDLAPSVLFLQYTNYQSKGDARAETPKNIILDKYANTDYARLIREPDYYKKIAEKNKEMENKYETTYLAYTQKQWKSVIQQADVALEIVTDPTLKSKYAYLRAVAIGQTKSKEEYRQALQTVISDYATEKVSELAKILLNALDPAPVKTEQTVDKTNKNNQKEEPTQPFTYAPKEWHYVCLIVNIHKRKIMDVKTDVSDFNRTFYSLQKMSINSFYITQNEQIVTVSKFTNKETAMDYYRTLVGNEKFKDDILVGNIKVYAMSAGNYSTYYKQKAARTYYEDFFNENYLP